MLSAPMGCSSPCLFRKRCSRRLPEGALTSSASSAERWLLPSCSRGMKAMPVGFSAGWARESRRGRWVWLAGAGGGARVVGGLGDEAAHVRVHAVRSREEDAAVGRDGGEAVEQEVERRLARAAGGDAVDRLAELHLVAQEHEVLRRSAGGDEVGQRHLAGLVDEEAVERMFQGRVDEVLARLQVVLSTRKRRLQILEGKRGRMRALQEGNDIARGKKRLAVLCLQPFPLPSLYLEPRA